MVPRVARSYLGALRMARPKGTIKPDSMVQRSISLSMPKEFWEWYDSLPKGNKAKKLREAIALYRDQIMRLGDREVL